jgi:uncharacterized protein YjbI with pentapeptide repeats
MGDDTTPFENRDFNLVLSGGPVFSEEEFGRLSQDEVVRFYAEGGKVMVDCNDDLEAMNRLTNWLFWAWDLAGANLPGVNFARADFRGANLDEINLCGANLEGACLIAARLEGANLASANLRNANLRRATLTGANLEGANLEGADLSSASLRSTNFERSNLTGAEFGDYEPLGIDIVAALAGHVEETVKLDITTVPDIRLAGATMPDGTIHD